MQKSDDYFIRLKNVAVELNSSSGDALVPLYTPGTKEGIPLNGYLVNFICSMNVVSTPEIPRQESPHPLQTQKEIDDAFYESVKDLPGKQFSIWYSIENGPPIRRFGLTCWNQRPGYQEDLIPLISSKNILSIAPGTTIYAKAENYNSGLLSGDDKISFFLEISEEADTSLASEPIGKGIPLSIIVNATPTLVLADNPKRRGAMITNRGTAPIYLARNNTPIPNAGLTLMPGMGFEINRLNLYKKSVYAIVENGQGILDVEEAE